MLSSNEEGISGAGMVSVNILDTAVEASVTESTVTEPGLATVRTFPSPSAPSIRPGSSRSAARSRLGMGSGSGAAIGYNEIDGTVSGCDR